MDDFYMMTDDHMNYGTVTAKPDAGAHFRQSRRADHWRKPWPATRWSGLENSMPR